MIEQQIVSNCWYNKAIQVVKNLKWTSKKTFDSTWHMSSWFYFPIPQFNINHFYTINREKILIIEHWI